jgi:hypothetical protein
MTMEVRYIVFTPDESRNATVAFVLKQGIAVTANDVANVDLAGDHNDPSAIVQLRPPLSTEPIKFNSQYLIAALLLYCGDRRIPIPKRSQKRAEISLHGLTLVSTTDSIEGPSSVAHNHVTYGAIANRATQEISTAREELARALARAHHAETVAAQAEATARRIEAARARSTALLVRVALVPGLRGRLGRWLVHYNDPNSDDPA